MKLLKIEGSQGYYLNEKDEFSPIDKITKEDLLRLVNRTLAEEVTFDEYQSNDIPNQAQQILYSSIYEKLRGLGERRQEFIDESERLYLKEFEKYRDAQPS